MTAPAIVAARTFGGLSVMDLLDAVAEFGCALGREGGEDDYPFPSSAERWVVYQIDNGYSATPVGSGRTPALALCDALMTLLGVEDGAVVADLDNGERDAILEDLRVAHNAVARFLSDRTPSTPKETHVETKILTCDKCRPHPYQDKQYGRNRRVMNQTMTTPGVPKKYRCTICGTERQE